MEEKITLDLHTPYTLTVYDDGLDGFLSQDAFYNISKTEYIRQQNHDGSGSELSHNTKVLDDEQNMNGWTTHESDVATVRGGKPFERNNHVLTTGSLKPVPLTSLLENQDLQALHIHPQKQHVTMEAPITQILYDDGKNHPMGPSSHFLLMAFTIICTTMIGLFLFVGLQMYRTRQRGVGIIARELEWNEEKEEDEGSSHREHYDYSANENDEEKVAFAASHTRPRLHQPTEYRQLLDDVLRNEMQYLQSVGCNNKEGSNGVYHASATILQVSTSTSTTSGGNDVPTYVTVS